MNSKLHSVLSAELEDGQVQTNIYSSLEKINHPFFDLKKPNKQTNPNVTTLICHISTTLTSRKNFFILIWLRLEHFF